MLHVGIIGFGKMGMLHGALLNGSRKAKVVAICDKSFVMRFGFKRVYKGVKCYTDIDKMLNENNLDILIVSTPTFNHLESVTKGLEYGCSIFVEKPLVSNLDDALKLCGLKDKNNGKIQVGLCNRYIPAFYMGKTLLEKSRIGPIHKAEAEMYIGDVFEAHTGWRYKKNISGGGVLMDFGIHMIDMLYWYFGEVRSVTSTSKKLYSIEVEDELSSKMSFKNNVEVSFETSWSKEDCRKSFSKIDIKGEQGSIIVTDQTVEVLDFENRRLEYYTYPDLYSGAFIDIGGMNFSLQMQAFLDYCVQNKEPLNTVESSIYVQKIIDAMYSSADTGKEVEVK